MGRPQLASRTRTGETDTHRIRLWQGDCRPAGQQGHQMELHQVLVGKDGQVIKRYAPLDKPADMAKDIEAALTL